MTFSRLWHFILRLGGHEMEVKKFLGTRFWWWAVINNKRVPFWFLLPLSAFRWFLLPALSVPGSPAPLSPSFLEYRLNIIQKHHLEIIFGDPSKKLYFHKLFVCFSAGTKNDTIPQDETNESFKGLTNGRTWRGSFSVELLCWPVRFLFLTPSHFVFYLLPPFKFAPNLTRSAWSVFYYERASRDAQALRFVWDTLCCVIFFCWNFCWFFCHSKIYSLLLTSCAGILFVTLWSCHFQGQMIEIDITCWSFCGILSNWFWPSIQKKSNYSNLS